MSRRAVEVSVIEFRGETYVQLTDVIDALLCTAETTQSAEVVATSSMLAERFGELIKP